MSEMTNEQKMDKMKAMILKQRKEIKILELKNNILNQYNKMNIVDDEKRRNLIDYFIKEEMERMWLLEGVVSDTLVWSYKYQTLISPTKMEEIKEEELEYIENQKAVNKEDTQ